MPELRMTIVRILCLAAASVALGLFQPAAAQAPAGDRPNAVRIYYGDSDNPAHLAILDRLKKRRVLEDLQEFLSPLRMPAELTIRMENCSGLVNAWYANNTITYCYDLIDYMRKNAPATTTPEGLAPEDAVVGAFVDIMLHELSHAVFDLLKVPVFGREEDAADALAAFVLLQFGKDVARRTITGTAHFWSTMAAGRPLDKSEFATGHGVPDQRFYNVLCIAYGADRDLFGDFVRNGLLPRQRAASCDAEYRQIRYAYQRLVAPHVDVELQKQVQGRQWLKPDDGKQ
jgi:hypothetical protein